MTTAVKLLEDLGTNAELRNRASELFFQAFPDTVQNESTKIWCALVPAKEEEEEKPGDDEKDSSQLSH